MNLIILAFVLILIIHVFVILFAQKEGFILHPDSKKLIDLAGGEDSLRFLEYSAKIGRDGWNTDRYDFVVHLDNPRLFEIIPEGMYREFEGVVNDHGSQIKNDMFVGYEKRGDQKIVKLYIEDSTRNENGDLLSIMAIGTEHIVDDIPISKYKMISQKKYSKMDRDRQFDFSIIRNLISQPEFNAVIDIISGFKHVAKKVKGDKEAYYFQIRQKNLKVEVMEPFLRMFNRDILDTEWYSQANDRQINWVAFEKDNDQVNVSIYFLRA